MKVAIRQSFLRIYRNKHILDGSEWCLENQALDIELLVLAFHDG